MDRMRPTFPIAITFADGEIPDARKLSGLASQSKFGQATLATAIGDPWNQSGDAFLALAGNARALMIPNLSRLVGASANLNPRFATGNTGVGDYTHQVSASDVGKYECTLSLLPDTGSAMTWGGTSSPTTLVGGRGSIRSAGDWYVDPNSGQCYFFDAIQADWDLNYVPVTTTLSELGFHYHNVIPDLRTEATWAFQGCKIAYANNADNTAGYIIFFPPRGPLTSTDPRGPQSRYSVPPNLSNETPLPNIPPTRFWQDDTIAATTTAPFAEVYRYVLPDWITTWWSSASQIPEGTVYLWDYSQTKTVIEGLTIRAETAVTPRKYVLIASGTALDNWVTTYMDAAYAACGGVAALTQRDVHTSIYYPSTGLRAVVASLSVSEVVAQLVSDFLSHDHSNMTDRPMSAVDHANTIGLFDPEQSTDPATQPVLASFWSPGDDHPQYLHRGGASRPSDRDPYKGGMFGDMIMLSEVPGPGNTYLNFSADSRKLFFGNNLATSPSIFWNYDISAGLNGLTLRLDSTYNKLCVYGDGAGPYVMFLEEDSGRRTHLAQGTASGELFIEDPVTYSQGGREGGSLHCNRFYSGNFTHADYGQSAITGGYGQVRYHVIAPTDWMVFRINGVADPQLAEACDPIPRMHDPSGAAPTDSHRAMVVDLARQQSGGPWQRSYAWAYINLPFNQYAIVNVGSMICPIVANDITGLGIGSCILGYSNQVGSFAPTGTIVDEVDMAAVDSGAWASLGTNNWTPYSEIFTQSGTALITVNQEESPTPTSVIVPWFAFMLTASVAGNDPAISIGTTIVYYRVKEH